MEANRKKALELLNSYNPLSKEISLLLEERDNLRACLFTRNAKDGSPADCDFVRKRLSQEITKLEKMICRSIEKNINSRMLIEELINSAQPADARPILRYRYVERVPMEFIPPRVHYSLRHCWNLHNKAVDSIALHIG